MLAPSPSFKSVIAAYRQGLAIEDAGNQSRPVSEVLDCCERHPGVEAVSRVVRAETDKQGKLLFDILKRWEQHGAVEEIWNTIRAKLKKPTPASLFIRDVIQLRIEMEEVARVVQQSPDLERKMWAKAKRYVNRKEAHKASDVLERIAGLQESQEILSRKKETAHRQRFMRYWRRKFKQACGQPFDGIVAALTEIAFGVEVTEEQVRVAARLDRTIRGRK